MRPYAQSMEPLTHLIQKTIVLHCVLNINEHGDETLHSHAESNHSNAELIRVLPFNNMLTLRFFIMSLRGHSAIKHPNKESA